MLQEILCPHTLKEAYQIQLNLQKKLKEFSSCVMLRDLSKIRVLGACDVAFLGQVAIGGVLVFEYPSLKVIERRYASWRITFPYVPGYLSFREAPVLVEAFRKVHAKIELLLADGQGRAHPRQIGLATHLGIVLGIPTVGCAKSRLYGVHAPLGKNKGSWRYLQDPTTHEILGAVFRSRQHVRPIYVSVGIGLELEEVLAWLPSVISHYRIPEPLRLVDQWVGSLKRQFQSSRG